MKISKLFHWLYAILMLLPAFFVGGRMAYTIFNKNAKDSYSGTNVNAFTDVVPNTYLNGQQYTLNIMTDNLISSEVSVDLFGDIKVLQGTSATNINNINENCVNFRLINNGSNNMYISFRDDQNNTLSNINLKTTRVILDFTSSSYLGPINEVLNYLSYKLFNDNYSLDNAFTYSMDQLNEVGLFSWAKDSFIVEPFRYITGLFGIASDSPVLTLLSYWCSISLIWLTFDLLMYVPLLVHRWIDKGMME